MSLKLRCISTIIALLIIQTLLLAQPNLKQWDKRFGGSSDDVAWDVISVGSSGYLLTGSSTSAVGADKSEDNRGSGDFWVVRTDVNGNKLWDKRFGGSASDWSCKGLYAASENCFYIVGNTSSDISGDKQSALIGSQDVWVVKLNASGVKIWEVTLGGTSFEEARSACLAADGGIVVGARTSSNISGSVSVGPRGTSPDYWIVKINSNGVKQWDKRFGSTNGSEWLWEIIKTNDNGFLINGESDGSAGFDRTSNGRGLIDYWVIKTDSNGVKQWDAVLGGSGNDYGRSCAVSPDGGYLIGGQSRSDISGDRTQARYSSGTFDGDYWVVKLNSNGTKAWDARFGSTDEETCADIVTNGNSGYYLVGTTSSPSTNDITDSRRGTSGSDGWIVYINASGVKQWDKRFGSESSDTYYSGALAADGNLIFCGYIFSNADNDISLSPRGSNDMSVCKFSENGVSSVTGLPATFCPQGTYTLNYSATGFSGNTTVKVELSNTNGAFDNPLLLNSTLHNGNISFTLPYPLSTGTWYRIRLTSSNPFSETYISPRRTVPSAVSPAISPSSALVSCTSPTVSLSSANSSIIASRTWLLNGSPIANSNTAAYLATAPGNFSVQYTNTTAQGSCVYVSNTVPVTLTGINDSIAYTGSLTSCVGSQVVLRSQLTNANHQWFLNNNLLSTLDDSLVATQSGLYKLVTAVGPCSDTNQIQIAFIGVPAQPGAISGASSVLFDSVYTYSIQAVALATSYTWQLPAGWILLSGQGTNTITAKAQTQSGSISVFASGSCGNSNPAALNVTVAPVCNTPPPKPTVILGTSLGACPSSTQTYSVAPVSGATSYLWTVPSGWILLSGQGTNTISIQLASNFKSGTLSVRALNDCGSSVIQKLTVYATPKITAIKGNIAGYCQGTTGNIYVANQTGALSYHWSVPSGMQITNGQGTNAIDVITDNTFVGGNVCVYGVSSCGNGASRCQNINTAPAVPGTITGSASRCAGVTTTYSVQPVFGATSYLWTLPAGWVIQSGAGTNQITVTVGTSGSVQVNAVNLCGSSIAKTKNVTVSCKMDWEVGESSITNVYPNPTDKLLYIDLNTDFQEPIEYQLFDIQGKLILNGMILGSNSENLHQIDVQFLDNGVYLLKLSNNAFQQTRMVIKK